MTLQFGRLHSTSMRSLDSDSQHDPIQIENKTRKYALNDQKEIQA